MQPNLKIREQKLCPANFVAYKGSCYFHGPIPGDYDHCEEQCAKVGSRVITIKERATYQFIRAWASAYKFGNIYLGLNFTNNQTDAHAMYSDGTPFNKTNDYAFDDQAEKFGNKDCAYLKRGVAFKPRESECGALMEQVCQWNSKYAINTWHEHIMGPSVAQTTSARGLKRFSEENLIFVKYFAGQYEFLQTKCV